MIHTLTRMRPCNCDDCVTTSHKADKITEPHHTCQGEAHRTGCPSPPSPIHHLAASAAPARWRRGVRASFSRSSSAAPARCPSSHVPEGNIQTFCGISELPFPNGQPLSLVHGLTNKKFSQLYLTFGSHDSHFTIFFKGNLSLLSALPTSLHLARAFAPLKFKFLQLMVRV